MKERQGASIPSLNLHVLSNSGALGTPLLKDLKVYYISMIGLHIGHLMTEFNLQALSQGQNIGLKVLFLIKVLSFW